MCCLVASVSDQLESANHLANGEEAQTLRCDNTTGHQLCIADTADLVQDAGGCGTACARCLCEKAAWVANSLESTLEVGLKRGYRAGRSQLALSTLDGGGFRNLRWSHLLSLEDKLRQLKTNACIIDRRWDLSLGCSSLAIEFPQATGSIQNIF